MRKTILTIMLFLVGWRAGAQEGATIQQIVLSGDATRDSGSLAVMTDTYVYIYDLRDVETPPYSFELETNYGGIGLNHDGTILVVPGECNTLDWLATSTGERVAMLTLDRPYCDSLQLTFSHNGELVFVNTGELYHTQDILDDGSNHGDEAVWRAIDADLGLSVFGRDDTLLAYRQPGGVVAIYDILSGELMQVIPPTDYMMQNSTFNRDFVFSTDSDLLATLVYRGPTEIFDIQTGEMLQSYWQDTETDSIAAWVDDTNEVIRSVHGGYQDAVYWRIYTNLEQTLDDVPPIELEALDAAMGLFSADGSLLVIATHDNRLAFYDGTNGTLLSTLSLP